MGGHGGLNILPQKSWNVYNFENREKVRKDEEAAAKEEQVIKQVQSRKRDAEFRLDKLKASRGLPSAAAAAADTGTGSSTDSTSKSNHFNLLEGLKVFPFLGSDQEQENGQSEASKMRKRQKKEETAPEVMLPEDEKYRLGYGLAGKGVKAPWYLSSPSSDESGSEVPSESRKQAGGKNSAKKTLQELREERLKRERREKEREHAFLIQKNNQRDGAAPRVGGLSRRNEQIM